MGREKVGRGEEGGGSDIACKNLELSRGKSVCLGLPHDRIL